VKDKLKIRIPFGGGLRILGIVLCARAGAIHDALRFKLIAGEWRLWRVMLNPPPFEIDRLTQAADPSFLSPEELEAENESRRSYGEPPLAPEDSGRRMVELERELVSLRRQANRQIKVLERVLGLVSEHPARPAWVRDLAEFLTNTLRHFPIRAVLEEEQRTRRRLLSELEPGQIVEGWVSRATDTGIYVDLDGVDFFAYVPDMFWGSVDHPLQVVGLGEDVKLKVLGSDLSSGELSLALA
jgi:hypothetical protein